MKSIGGAMLCLGIGSILLNIAGMQFALLAWIDVLGPMAGWLIKLVLIAAGTFFYLGGRAIEAAPREQAI